MKRPRQTLAILRATGILAILSVTVTGVTFAALRSQNNMLNGSRMVSASADLTMAKANNNQWFTTLAGFEFLDVAPGGIPSPQTGNDLYFRNGGSTNLDLRISLNPTRLSNPNGVNLQKARLLIVGEQGTPQYVSYTLAELSQATVTSQTLPMNIVLAKNNVAHFRVMLQLDDGAVTGTSQATLENIDLVFSGVAENT